MTIKPLVFLATAENTKKCLGKRTAEKEKKRVAEAITKKKIYRTST